MQAGLPSTMTAYPKPIIQGGAKRQQQPPARGSPTGSPSAGRAEAAAAAGSDKQGAERVLRTVFLPTVDPDFLLLKIESLQAQLAEQVSAQVLAWVAGLAE